MGRPNHRTQEATGDKRREEKRAHQKEEEKSVVVETRLILTPQQLRGLAKKDEKGKSEKIDMVAPGKNEGDIP